MSLQAQQLAVQGSTVAAEGGNNRIGCGSVLDRGMAHQQSGVPVGIQVLMKISASKPCCNQEAPCTLSQPALPALDACDRMRSGILVNAVRIQVFTIGDVALMSAAQWAAQLGSRRE